MKTHQILAIAEYQIRTHGWTSKAQAQFIDAPRSTAELVLENMDAPITDADSAVASAVRAWAASLSPTNSFEHNLKEILAQDEIETCQAGLVASSVWWFHKAERRDAQASRWDAIRERSRYQGAKGVRQDLTVEVLSYQVVRWYHLYRFVDSDNNLYLTFRATALRQGAEPIAVGTLISIRATVKRHEVFRGTEQTILGRVSLV